jgi:hypothetical protein
MNDPDTSADPRSAPESEPASEPVSAAPSGGAETPDGVAQESLPPESQAQPAAHAQPAAQGTDSLPTPPEPVPHAGARYALLRLLMLVAVGGILYVLGMRGWLLAFTAILVSGVVSLFLLMKQRNDAAVNLERTVDSWKHRRDQQDAGLAQD